MTNAISGMAASIRASTDSETFDLAGHDAANINTTIADAFSAPFALDHMIRITFVTGAGKLSRQKYDDKAMQTLTSALRQLGYVEDRGASCVDECGGSYKTQHDTGKNLFTVVAFPKLVETTTTTTTTDEARDGGDIGGGASPADEYPMSIPLVEGTPEHVILLASEDTFEKMIPSACPSWSEKKACSEVLRAALETVEKLDARLMSGTPLSDDENAFYDGSGGAASVMARGEIVKRLMHEQAETGSLTKDELERLLHQVRERIESLDGDIDAATRKSQEKKAAKLGAQKEKARARERMLDGRDAMAPRMLKHEAQIAKLHKRLKPLLKMEKETKGRLLTAKEAKELAPKDEIEEEIEELEAASMGWFEDDDAFLVRLDASRSKRKTPASASGGKSSSSGGKGKKPGTGSRSATGGGGGATKFFTPGGVAAKQAALGQKAAAKKKANARSNGAGAFAAMMLDSDSESD